MGLSLRHRCRVGAVIPAEVQANRDALFAPIPPALWADLRDARLLREDAPVPADSAEGHVCQGFPPRFRCYSGPT